MGVDDCWNMCTSQHPETTNIEFACGDGSTMTGDSCWCYCQDDCMCMAEVGDSGTAAPVGSDFTPAQSCCPDYGWGVAFCIGDMFYSRDYCTTPEAAMEQDD